MCKPIKKISQGESSNIYFNSKSLINKLCISELFNSNWEKLLYEKIFPLFICSDSLQRKEQTPLVLQGSKSEEQSRASEQMIWTTDLRIPHFDP
jgi:hypothetical protein